MPGSELHCVRGCGVVNAAPADILALLTTPERRKWYDEMCTESKLVQQLDANTALHYTRFEARDWFCATAARDFAMLAKWTRMQDGVTVVVRWARLLFLSIRA